MSTKKEKCVVFKLRGAEILAYTVRGTFAGELENTKELLEDWYAAINRTNTGDMPTELIGLYEEAAVAICQIQICEKNIVTGEGAR